MSKPKLNLSIKSGFSAKNGGLPVQNDDLPVQNGGLPVVFIFQIF
jgi:hypothetical protein